MEYDIKEVSYDNIDFQKLCQKLDDFQNNIFPERINLKMSALNGLEKIEKIFLIYDGER